MQEISTRIDYRKNDRLALQKTNYILRKIGTYTFLPLLHCLF